MSSTQRTPVALVTGASAGIGAAFATLLAERGHDLVLVARRRDRLEQIATELHETHGVTARVEVADLADPRSPAMLVDRLTDAGVAIDVLVNNAGYGLDKPFLRAEWTAHRDFLEVLVVSVVHLSRLLVPAMVERGSGRVVNVASLAAFAPEPNGSLYTAAKKFVVSFTRALSLELDGTGVTATAVCPGFTYSEFHDVMNVREEMNRLPKWLWQEARPVVEEGWRAAERGRVVVTTGTVNKLLAGVCSITPFSLASRMTPRTLKNRLDDGDAR